MITLAGHPDLTAPTPAMLEEELPGLLATSARVGAVGLVRAGPGLPVAFAKAACATGLALVTVLPTRNGVSAKLDPHLHQSTGRLLFLAERVRRLEY